MSDLDIFDHRRFSGLTDAAIINRFKKGCKFLGYSNIPTVYVTEYVNLLKQIKADPVELCEKSKSSPRLAWAVLLERYTVTEFLRKIVLSATIIPFGTAEGNFLIMHECSMINYMFYW